MAPKEYTNTTKMVRRILGFCPHIFERNSPAAKNKAEIKSQTIAGMEINIFINLF